MNGKIALLPTLLILMVAATTAVAEPKCTLQKFADLPVTMEGLSPVVSAKINGAPMQLVADTGAFYSILKQSAADRARMTATPSPFNVRVGGITGTAAVNLYTAKDFELGGVALHRIEFLVGGPEGLGEVGGFLGQNILSAMDLEVDLGGGMIRMFKPAGCEKANLAYWAGGKPASVIPIEPLGPQQRVIAGFAYVNGQRVRVMFDTGAQSSFLTRQAAERVGINIKSDAVRNGGEVRGFGRRVAESWISPVASFSLGDEQIQNTRLRVGDIVLQQSDMLIGADFFLSHHVFVANSQHKLYFTYSGGPVFKLDRPTPAPAAVPATAGVGAGQPEHNLKDAGEYARRAAASSARRDFAAAVADLSEAIALQPQMPQLYDGRALAKLQLGETDLALLDADQALKFAPGDAKSLLVRGLVYLSRNDLARAEADFASAVRASPDDASLVFASAYALEHSDHFEAAIARLDPWIAAHPKNAALPKLANERCWISGLWGRQLDVGVSACNLAVTSDAKNAGYLDSRALVYFRMGRLDEAISDYDAALKLQPKQVWSLYGRGLAKQKKGVSAEGMADIQAALALDPKQTETMKHYGLIGDQPAAH